MGPGLEAPPEGRQIKTTRVVSTLIKGLLVGRPRCKSRPGNTNDLAAHTMSRKGISTTTQSVDVVARSMVAGVPAGVLHSFEEGVVPIKVITKLALKIAFGLALGGILLDRAGGVLLDDGESA